MKYKKSEVNSGNLGMSKSIKSMRLGLLKLKLGCKKLKININPETSPNNK